MNKTLSNLQLFAFNLQLFANANTNVTSSEGLSDAMKTYYSDYLIDNAIPKLVHDQFGQKHPIPKNGGKTIEFRKYSPLPKLTSPITEGVTPDGQSLNMSTITATVAQYGGYITLSDILILTAIDNMLSGVLGVLDSIRYSEKGSDVVADLSTEIMSSYMLQYVPSLFGAVARTFDEIESRTSRPSVNGDKGFIEMLGRKVANKVPVLRNIVGSKPYVDIMGKYDKKESGRDYVMSALQNFILPGYISKITSSDATAELSKIVRESERTDFIPKYVSKIGTHKLTHDEYFEYHKIRGNLYDEVIPYLAQQEWYNELESVQKSEILAGFKEAADRLTKKSLMPSYNFNNKKLENIYVNGSKTEDIVNVYLVDQYIGLTADANNDDKLEKAEIIEAISDMSLDNDAAWGLYLSKYDSKAATEAKEFGIDAKLFMTAVADMGDIKADYRENGKVISGSRRTKVEKYLNSVCNSYKEYLYLLGMEYPSVKKDYDYIKYFGNE